MTDLRTAAQQALDALYDIDATGVPVGHIDLVIDALKAALAQEEQEPVAWRYQNANTDHVYLVWEKGNGGRNWTPLFESPCQTCVSLARSVMMDQVGKA